MKKKKKLITSLLRDAPHVRIARPDSTGSTVVVKRALDSAWAAPPVRLASTLKKDARIIKTRFAWIGPSPPAMRAATCHRSPQRRRTGSAQRALLTIGVLAAQATRLRGPSPPAMRAATCHAGPRRLKTGSALRGPSPLALRAATCQPAPRRRRTGSALRALVTISVLAAKALRLW